MSSAAPATICDVLKSIDEARKQRRGRKLPAPSRLYTLAEEDARGLLNAVVAELGGTAAVRQADTAVGELVRNTAAKALTAGIFRHALLEAGALEQDNGEPFTACPYCGRPFV